jgi:adenylylsulfate kinase
MILLLCGLSGAGKSTLATHVKNKLGRADIAAEIIDADEYRQKLFKDLGYTREDRNENIRRLGFIANKFSSLNIVTIVSAINPYDDIRKELIESYPNVKVVHIDCDINVLIDRDTKGLYKKALLPDNHPDKISNLTGINDPFEIPESPDLYINTSRSNIKHSTGEVYNFVLQNIIKENYGINPLVNVAV